MPGPVIVLIDYSRRLEMSYFDGDASIKINQDTIVEVVVVKPFQMMITD